MSQEKNITTFAYKDATGYKLTVTTGVNFNLFPISASSIQFIKPTGATGSFTSSVEVGKETIGNIYVEFGSSVKFDSAGVWKLWASITLSSGSRTLIGKPFYIRVLNPGEDAQNYI